MKIKKKRLLLEFEDYSCEKCRKVFKENELHIHRIRRNWEGGKYELRNCMVVCKTCHKKLHSNEFRNIRS